jgi:hypothetical protein
MNRNSSVRGVLCPPVFPPPFSPIAGYRESVRGLNIGNYMYKV